MAYIYFLKYFTKYFEGSRKVQDIFPTFKDIISDKINIFIWMFSRVCFKASF